MLGIKRVLILAPHTDDGEFGCGGTIARFVEEGKEVFYVAFSLAKQSIPKNMPLDSTAKEVREATSVLGIKEKNLIIYDFEVRKFPEFRQEILEEMVKLNNDIKPELVLLPSTFDTHQDHKTISEEGFRAFKRTSLMGYEVLWNNLTFDTNMFVFITENHLNLKIESLSRYMSQKTRSYSNNNFEIIEKAAAVRGVQIGSKYAEVFEVIRFVIK